MIPDISRRDFARLAALATASGALPVAAAAAADAPATKSAADARDPRALPFPDGFLWGSATASYQVEGAVHEDGRGQTIWDTFSHTPGKTHNGDTGDVADDQYHRYQGDIDLMRDLGLKAFRFSIAWSRIFPDGTGKPNQKGIDHYRRLTEALRAAGIEPYCTLYHWDLPQALQDRGGWQNRDTAQAFADYAGYFTGRLSDLITNFMTMNEISSFIEYGHRLGQTAPGLKLARGALAQARHHAVLGHGLAVQAMRASGRRSTRIGSAEAPEPITPIYDAPEHVAAARIAMLEENAGYLGVMRTGRYTDRYLAKLGPDAPKFTDADLKAIGSPMDFQGINIYSPSYVRAADNADGYVLLLPSPTFPNMWSSWLTVGPEALYWAPKLVAEVFGISEIYITENGGSADDTLAADGEVYDIARVMYLKNYLMQLQRAVRDGVPVKGYFVWSLLDNYEWDDGYAKRFGITYVDFATQKRTPKLSAKFYKDVVARNGL